MKLVAYSGRNSVVLALRTPGRRRTRASASLEIAKTARSGLMRRAFERYVHGGQAATVKPAIDVHQMGKCPAYRDRRRKKNDGQHHLRRDQGFASQPRGPGVARSADS